MKKRFPFLLSLILLLSVYIFSQQRGFKVVHTPQGKDITLYKGSYALVVGNGKYTAGWDELSGAVNDAEGIADVLRKNGFKVTLVKNVDKGTFLSELGNFTYKHGQDEDNQLLFYYAGHGHTTTLASGEELGYLVMVDAPLPEKDNFGFDNKSVDMQTIITYAKKIKSKHALFIFDSCFSGTVLNLRARVIPKAISDAVRYPVRQFITAGRAAEPVPDRSVFKQLLIDILEGKIEEPIKDGYITGEELGLFLKSRVPEYNKFQHPQYGKIRDPNLDKGDFVFVLEKAGPGVQEEIPTPPTAEKLDLSSIEESAKRREEARRKWSNWQEQMESDFKKVKSIDQNPENTAEEKKSAWDEFLRNYKADNPFSTEDEQLRQRAAQRLKALSKVEMAVRARVSLRSVAGNLSENEVGEMLKRKNFFSKRNDWNKNYCNPRGDFANEYEVKTIRGDKVVLDHATGLMWHQSGSEKTMTYIKAKQWIDELNSRGHADYTDWRLPTLEEVASLLERSKMNGDLYVDPLFSAKQIWIWTGDTVNGYPGWAWVVHFDHGHVLIVGSGGSGLYVRPVRKKLSESNAMVKARVSLRSSGQSLSWNEGKSMVKRKNFFDSSWNKSGGFENEYESKTINGDKVVLDHATGLMWHQSGSDVYMKYNKAKKWVGELNRRGYAGYSDWRLPTLEEGASLIERSKMNGDLYIIPKFSAKQTRIWMSDMVTDYPGMAWIVFFVSGDVRRHSAAYVRPVRSGR